LAQAILAQAILAQDIGSNHHVNLQRGSLVAPWQLILSPRHGA